MRNALFALAACAVLAVGCGGGGGGGDSGSNTSTNPGTGGGGGGGGGSTALTGVFIDSPVQGLNFSTPTRSGVTDASGNFSYNAGETVTFTLYGQVIGSTVGSSILTPFNLQAIGNHTDYAINLLRFLQTMDSDNNPANGITLAAVTATLNVNFNQATTAFESDAAVTGFIAPRTLVSTANALAHFETAVSAANSTYTVNLATMQRATEVITRDGCPFAAGLLNYAFTNTGATITGSDSWDGCVVQASTPETLTYTAISDVFDCGPVCSFAALNRVRRGYTDADGRTANLTVSHAPGSNLITVVKTILTDNQGNPVNTTFRSRIAINLAAGYAINLEGRTAATGARLSLCANNIEDTATYTFSATGYSTSDVQTFEIGLNSNCTLGAGIDGTYTYSAIPESVLACGPVCTHDELNYSRFDVAIPGTDDAGNPITWTADTMAYHLPGTNTITETTYFKTENGTPLSVPFSLTYEYTLN